MAKTAEAKAAEKAAKEAEKKAQAEAKAAEKAAKAEARSFTVFYKELLPDGRREGATASKQFDNREDADEFAAKVNGKVR